MTTVTLLIVAAAGLTGCGSEGAVTGAALGAIVGGAIGSTYDDPYYHDPYYDPYYYSVGPGEYVNEW
jgi:hypothetical protein